ncbi:pyridoxal phosphate-dependent aminotransferase [Gracilibacillus caseinilyticus]|uniref:cysteine-S-conjugate beta-lyase n=1 Tax=Gracilibacillus caseinilyticus TaxID=2932256 RepID=A0ABY4EVL6_9BACI|nr:MalY/PatB family protein [Gracilibacillus caseinilyticus]UOQ48106.1 pyridoxal phosphate-dependent aminotransferase [Gracilibacillus caseinilyticus]
MTHSFEKQIERRNTRAVKWDLVKSLYGAEDVLPMWVADMDFEVPEEVIKALTARAKHGVFGYTFTDHALASTITEWLNDRHDWQVKKPSILYSPGVITTLYMAIQTFTNKGDKVLIQTPVYPPFYQIVTNHDRELVKNQLVLRHDRYEIDFDDFEAKLQEGVKAFILCNPHNPVGRVWTETELRKIVALCKKYNVMILSDEIHADLVYSNNKHIPIAKLDEEMADKIITCMSPTKTFNLAGLQVSYAIVPNRSKREALEKTFQKQGIHILNTMGITALDAAYQHGREWLEQLLAQLTRNIDYVVEAFAEHPRVDVIRPEGTYLVWLDFRKLQLSQADLKDFLQTHAKVGLNDGASFGEEGTGFMRMNVACPFTLVEEGTNRIIKALG